MAFRLSEKYARRLEVYLRWTDCSSPLGEHAARFIKTGFGVSSTGVSAAAAMSAWESRGVRLAVLPQDETLASRYCIGKANRDWWTKEMGWWRKHASYIPEDFLIHMHPDCFDELFGRYPIGHIVRWVYDNSYTQQDLDRDIALLERGFEAVPGGVIYRGRHDA